MTDTAPTDTAPTDTAPTGPADRLAAFAEGLLADPTEEGFAAAVAAHPGVFEAALDWLHGRYVLGRPLASDFERSDALRMVLVMLLSQMDDAGRARFLDETLLLVFHPDAYRELAPVVRRTIRPEELGARLLAAATDGGALEQRNAPELDYYVFDGDESYRLDPALRVAVDAALNASRG